jgi:hypothetical protein
MLVSSLAEDAAMPADTERLPRPTRVDPMRAVGDHHRSGMNRTGQAKSIPERTSGRYDLQRQAAACTGRPHSRTRRHGKLSRHPTSHFTPQSSPLYTATPAPPARQGSSHAADTTPRPVVLARHVRTLRRRMTRPATGGQQKPEALRQGRRALRYGLGQEPPSQLAPL